ncbi:hypothetical protein J2W90_003501 [Bacillus pumilus]|uniref:hypothetical protein n=1 Tax=Bacillus pumilus TaxID=1408 RepID=UPI002864CE46|nr:hypothetical protein [Bacillus pumilus]MDR6749331.1 hypothetical protein [Bacillus pumilus]
MQSNLCLVPISNFHIESVFKIGDIYFSPLYTQAEDNDLSFTDSVTKVEFEKIQNYIKLFNKSNQIAITNCTMAIKNVENLEYQNSQEAFTLVAKVCEEIDRTMDYFRLTNCQIGNFDTLPGIPGFIPDGFKTIYKWDKNTNDFVTISGEITFMFQKGIGLKPYNEPDARSFQEVDWRCIFSERKDEVFLNCRAALIRINEAMYMDNLNVAFIYLMTTIEMLADKDTMLPYRKVKSKILPFVAKNKKQYHELSEYMRDLSEFKRTEIVHNGKNIYDLYSNKSQVLKELFKVTGLIVKYVNVVICLETYTFDELETKRAEMKTYLGI